MGLSALLNWSTVSKAAGGQRGIKDATVERRIRCIMRIMAVCLTHMARPEACTLMVK